MYGDFASRLKKLLDHARFQPGRGRTTALANRYGVSRETARKWLTGLSLPELERMIELAVDFGGSFEWLATGRGPMLPGGQGVGEHGAVYRPDDTEPLRSLVTVVSALSRERQQALLVLLTSQ